MVYGFTEIALSIVSIVVCVFYYDEEEEQQHTCRGTRKQHNSVYDNIAKYVFILGGV